MAVRTATAPVRTCVGCRHRAAAAELLRVVVAKGSAGGVPDGTALVVPDPRRRAPGRGAWLHRDLECVERAQRRRAFARAFRTPGPFDPEPVREYVARLPGTSASGTPQELTDDGLSMKRQQ